MADRGCREPVSRAPIQSGHKISDRASERPRLPGRHLAGSRPQDKAVGPGWGVAQSYGGVRPLAYALSFGSDGTGLQGGRELRSNRAACASAVRVGRDRSMDETTVLDNVLQQAHVVHAGSVNGGGVVGEIRVDLSDLVESARLRTAMAVESLPGFNCMCLGDVRFEVFDRTGERLAVVVLHHGATLRWEAWESDAVLADGRLLLAWLDGHGMPGPLLQFEADRLREQEWTVEERNWQAAMPAGLEGLADRILGLSRTGGSPAPELLAELTDRLHLIFPDPVERVLALLGWYGSAGPPSPPSSRTGPGRARTPSSGPPCSPTATSSRPGASPAPSTPSPASSGPGRRPTSTCSCPPPSAWRGCSPPVNPPRCSGGSAGGSRTAGSIWPIWSTSPSSAP